jgi:hypothetical protein
METHNSNIWFVEIHDIQKNHRIDIDRRQQFCDKTAERYRRILIATLDPYTDTLETLSNIDSERIKISEIESTISTLKKNISGGKVVGADGKEITD